MTTGTGVGNQASAVTRAARRDVSVSDLVGVGSGASIAAVFDVLLVEDDAGDALLVGEALRDARDEVRLDVAGDGTQALAGLEG